MWNFVGMSGDRGSDAVTPRPQGTISYRVNDLETIVNSAFTAPFQSMFSRVVHDQAYHSRPEVQYD